MRIFNVYVPEGVSLSPEAKRFFLRTLPVGVMIQTVECERRDRIGFSTVGFDLHPDVFAIYTDALNNGEAAA